MQGHKMLWISGKAGIESPMPATASRPCTATGLALALRHAHMEAMGAPTEKSAQPGQKRATARKKAPQRGLEATPERPHPASGRRKEAGGPKGPEPTRYGDWERGGRCIDF